MTDDPAPDEGKATLADIIAMASHGTVCHQPAGFPLENRDAVVPHEAPALAEQLGRDEAREHVVPVTMTDVDRRRLVAAAASLRLAQERVAAALASGSAAVLPDAIAAARAAMSHLLAVR